MKSYAGNWQINHNSQNRMSEKMVSERMANEITELLRRDRKWDMDAREDLEQVFFLFFCFFYKIDKIKWRSNTWQSVLKSKGFYRTDSISFSLKVGRLFQDFLGLIKSFNLTRTCWKWFVQVYFLDNKWGLLIFNS
jgi:hypothetical protein